MSKQPRALEAAYVLEQQVEVGCSTARVLEAAALLRSQHELIGELVAMLDEAIQPLHLYRAYGWSDRTRVINRCESLLSKTKEQQ